jgi:hypothetical protein
MPRFSSPMGPLVSKAALVLPIAVLLSGCAWKRGEAEPAPVPTTRSAPVVVEAAPPPPPPRDRSEEILAEGAAFLAIGDFSASRSRIQYLLDHWEENDGGDVPAGLRAKALWHLGLLHLLPDAPDRDPERALSILTRLTEEYPATPEGVQAQWIRGLLQELDGARQQGAQQEQRIRELNETVEQLRRIDLNRRPAPPRPDTLGRSPESG